MKNKVPTPIIYLIASLLITIILNEVITILVSQILGLPYLYFPQSWWFNYEVIKSGNGIAIGFALLTLIWAGLLLSGAIYRSVSARVCSAVAIGILLGSLLGNMLFVALGNGGFSISPLYFFSVLMVRHELYS